MEGKWKTENNAWLRRLYDLRHKWSSAFGRDVFTCGIRSSQRNESTNNVFQRTSTKRLTLVEFIHYHEEQLKHMREIESQDDYSSRRKPKMHILNNEILTHAASLLTRTIFKRFNKEMLQSIFDKISSTTLDGSVEKHTLQCKGIQHEHVVTFDATNFSISCECKLFESKGWLCHHALRVLIENILVTGIPSSYNLKRWTKDAKQGNVTEESSQMSTGPSRLNRFFMLMQESFELMSLGAEDGNTMSIVRKVIQQAKTDISLYKSSLVVIEDANDDDNEATLCDIAVLDPLRRKGKGSYGRLKSASEKKKKQKKSKKGTASMQIESRGLVGQTTHDTYFPSYSTHSNQISSAFYPGNIGGPTIDSKFS